jgi:hypothetical protein
MSSYKSQGTDKENNIEFIYGGIWLCWVFLVFLNGNFGIFIIVIKNI